MTDWSGCPLITIDNDEEHVEVLTSKNVHAKAHVDTKSLFVTVC
jgi:hypothetical protein